MTYTGPQPITNGAEDYKSNAMSYKPWLLLFEVQCLAREKGINRSCVNSLAKHINFQVCGIVGKILLHIYTILNALQTIKDSQKTEAHAKNKSQIQTKSLKNWYSRRWELSDFKCVPDCASAKGKTLAESSLRFPVRRQPLVYHSPHGHPTSPAPLRPPHPQYPSS